MDDTTTTQVDASTTSTAAADRRAARVASLDAIAAAIAALDADDASDSDTTFLLNAAVLDAGRAVAAAHASTSTPKGPRATAVKAEPADVAAYFTSTGLTRKDLAAAALVSTSVIATVQNPNGDRWSLVTFTAKRVLIDAWIVAHADEIAARVATAAAEAQAKVDAAAAKAADAKVKADAKAAAAKAKAKADAAAARKAAKATPATAAA